MQTQMETKGKYVNFNALRDQSMWQKPTYFHQNHSSAYAFYITIRKLNAHFATNFIPLNADLFLYLFTCNTELYTIYNPMIEIIYCFWCYMSTQDFQI